MNTEELSEKVTLLRCVCICRLQKQINLKTREMTELLLAAFHYRLDHQYELSEAKFHQAKLLQEEMKKVQAELNLHIARNLYFPQRIHHD